MLTQTEVRNSVKLSVRVPSGLAEELERCAQRRGSSPSAEMRQAMLDHVARDFDARLGLERRAAVK